MSKNEEKDRSADPGKEHVSMCLYHVILSLMQMSQIICASQVQRITICMHCFLTDVEEKVISIPSQPFS